MTASDRIPQNDIGAGYRAQQAEIDAAVARVLASGWYILGAEVAAFERDFAAWLGVGHAVGVANGTDALALALRALDIGPGTAVATVAHSAVATVAAIEMVGATPVLVDIEPDHYGMDPGALAAALARAAAGDLPPIRAVIPVHIYGQPVALDAILDLARRGGLRVIEDCAQSHGATFDGRKTGSFGDIAAFSLYPTKNLGALGDGGVVATDDPALAARMAALRQYGWRARYISDEPGVNTRLDELQAAILRVRLGALDAQNARRGAIAARYDAALAGSAIAAPARRPRTRHVFHQYVVRTQRRDAVQAALAASGIGTAIHYPVPIHRQPAYAGRVALGPGGCPNTDAVAREILSLPMYPQLDDRQVDRICAALAAAAKPG
jgi:dTDP-4-amino-4,6-dideoxygalactose transaminase